MATGTIGESSASAPRCVGMNRRYKNLLCCVFFCCKAQNIELKKHTRTCTKPPPANGGFECYGPSTDIQTCGWDKCTGSFPNMSNILCNRLWSKLGTWSDWSQWGRCSTTCGPGALGEAVKVCPHPPYIKDVWEGTRIA